MHRRLHESIRSDRASGVIMTIISLILISAFVVSVMSHHNWDLSAALHWAWGYVWSVISTVSVFFTKFLFGG